MDAASIILEYVRVFLSTPVVVGVVATAAILIFKKDIKTLCSRIATIKLPGGGELLTSQQSRSTDEESNSTPPDVTDEQLNLPAELKFTSDQLAVVRNLYFSERANAYLWEYRYLNFFLVRATQYVLEWFASSQQPISLSLFHNVWTPIVRSAAERDAIINALQSHYLIDVSDSLVQITPKGREYIDWRGPMEQSTT